MNETSINGIIEHPSVIFEVSSPSTKVYYKTDKFIRFRKIQSLRHYIVVNSEKLDVEIYTKTDNEWTSESFTSLDAVLELEAVGVMLPLKDIYVDVL